MTLVLAMPRVARDLNSAAAVKTANITLSDVSAAASATIVRFECTDCLDLCRVTRSWLLRNADDDDSDRLVRLENQDLALLQPETCGTLVLVDGAAQLDGHDGHPVTLLALLIPGEHRVRFFWSLLSFSPLLHKLSAAVVIGQPQHVHNCGDETLAQEPGQEPNKTGLSGGMGMVGGAALALNVGTLGTAMLATSRVPNSSLDKRTSFYTFITQTFLKATTIPHSPDYAAALKLMDYCPPVQHPDTACQRIESSYYLGFSGETGRDLSDDRYILEVEPAERELISVVEMTCAAYILFKRQYFKALGKDVLREGDKVLSLTRRYGNVMPSAGAAPDTEPSRADTPSEVTGTPAPTDKQSKAYATWAKAARARASQTAAKNKETRVRTDHAHIRRIEADMGCTFTKAKRLFTGWTLLGFLDESRVLQMVQQGCLDEEMEVIKIEDDEVGAETEEMES